MIRIINGICYLLCVLCVFGAVALVLKHVWTPDLHSDYERNEIVSLIAIFVGSAIILGINRRFRK